MPTKVTGGRGAVAEGSGIASETYSHAEGNSTVSSGIAAHAEGHLSTASGYAAHAEGWQSVASGSYSSASGYGSVAHRGGQAARAAGFFIAAGDAQYSSLPARIQTTNATPATLTIDGGATVLSAVNSNVLTLLASRAHRFQVNVVARRSDVAGDVAGWEFTGLISRGSSGDAAFIGSIDSRAWGVAGAAAWDVTLSINTSNATYNYLAVTVTGEAAKTIRWMATIETWEVG